MADVSSGYSGADYSGITGMWNGSPWTTTNKVTTTTLWNYADADGNVTLTINNNPIGTTGNVVVTAANGDTLYSANGLRSSNYENLHITSFTVNMNYVTSVTLNSNSILDPSQFTAPKDYTVAFTKTRDESVGRIVFLGDSITHGVQDMSWRWGIFKTMVDNGIEYEIAGPLSGYHSDPLNGDYNGNYSSSQYGGAAFDNAHYAQSSGRTHNMLTASNSGNSLGGSTGVNYGGVTSAKVGKEYNGDTYIMMMGTNDILSDGANTVEKMATVTNRLLGEGSLANGTWSNAGVESPLVGLTNDNAAYRGEWGTMGKIIDNMKMGEGDVMYVMPVPTWGVGRTGLAVYADLVPTYNTKLEAWTKAYSDTHTGTVKFVDINRGLVDKTLNGTYLAPDAFFRTTGGDYIHPNEQGALIIAGNLAQGMGLAGRTAGLHRADSHTANTDWMSGAASYTINAGQSVTIGAGELDMNGGYTVDFSALYGNGATDGWLAKNNALSISVGDGSNVGTLKLSEGYISWGDKLLFCQDNSAQGNDNIRITYHTGDTANQVGNGYYVWLGDMLIGQALSGSTGTLSGITLSSVGATGTVNGLTYSNSAYAPTTKGMASESNAFYATITKVMTSHDSAPIAGPTDFSQAPTAVKTGNAVYGAASNAGGDVVATYGSALSGGGHWFAGQGGDGVEHTGNISLQVTEGASGAGMFGVVNTGTADGNVTVQVDGASLSAYTGGAASIIGAFAGNITGKFTAVMNSGTLSGGILGGFENAAAGNSIGSVDLIVNGGTVGGAILGGSKVANGTVDGAIGISVAGGTVNGRDGVAIIGSGTAGTVNGDIDITISGGVIKGDIIGKQTTGVTYGEDVDATVTVQGNKASITGNITADTVKLQNVAATDYTDGFDKYAGTITATNLVLDKYTAGLVNATLVTDYVTVSNGTNATIRGLHLRNCSIDADATSLLTLGGDIHSGNTISYTGNLYLEDGIRFTIDTPTDIEAGAEGLSSGQYIYKVADEGTGHLYAVDGSALTSAHTSTFTGTGDLAGKSFYYETATGALIAYASGATYNIATSTVNYSDLPTAANISMSGGQLNLDKALNAGVSITATGGTVSVGEGVQFSTSSLSGSAAIANNGGTVTIDTASTAATQLLTSITGDSGTVVMNQKVLLNNGASSSFGGTLIVNNANTDAYNDTSNNNSIKTGYDLVLGDNNTYNATADISSFSQVVLNNAGLYYGGNGTTINNLTLNEGSQSRLKVEHMASNTLTFAGKTTLAANSTLTALAHWTSNVTFENLVGDGTLQLWGRNTTSGASNNATYNVNSLQGFSGTLQFHKTVSTDTMTSNIATGSGKDVTIKGISLNDSNRNIVNITGAERLIVDGAVSVGTNGTLNIGNGTAATNVTLNGSLSGAVNVLANSTLKLGDTFSAESATINGAGYVDVHIKSTDTKELSLHNGQDGYLTATIDLSTYQNKVTFSNTGWKVDGVANNGASFNSDTYQLSVAGGNVFYVNTTVNKDEVAAPTGGGKAVLVGSGTYVLGSNMANDNAAWPGNAQISTDPTLWTGAVKFVNVSGMRADHDLNDYANSASWVHLNGVSGWDTNWAGHLTANLILENNGSNAAWTYEAGASSLKYMSVDGKVKGDGTMLLSSGSNQGVTFTNDISEWTGAITSAQGAKSIKFSGNATEVNAQIVKTGGTMNVIAETDVTFNNTVTVSSLTSNGHTITLGSHGEGESATHGNLTLNFVSDLTTLNINDGASATASAHNDGTGFIKGTVNVNAGGTLNIVGFDILGWGGNSTTAINMEGSEGKLATMTVSDKQTFSTTLNLNGYTKVGLGEGSSNNKGLEIFQDGGRIGTINATGTHNTIAAGVFLRSKTTITTAEGAELTISGDVRNGASGGAAEMVKEGAGTLTLSGNNSFGGNLTVNAGTVKMGRANALGAANGTGSRLITINEGGTIDINGQSDGTAYVYTLAGGSLVNNGSATGDGKIQTVGLKLTDDSVIGGTGDFYLISSRYGNTAVNLDGHTLTKTGSNTVNFWSTAVGSATDNAGILRVEDGVLNIDRHDSSKTLSSVYADIEVAKSSGNAVSGNFLLASGHTISSTEMGGSMDASIQLGGNTTLSIDGVNNLTLNGVLSNAADATGSITKTGVGTAILNAANTYTGTTTIDAGALIASNSDALSHSVVTFSDLSEAESPYRILAFAQNLSFNGATGALQGGTQIDGTIKGLDGHLGYVVANALTIDVDGGQTHTFNHRYDDYNRTSDRVEMKINRLVKTGEGTQIIGGDYSEARGFTTNGLVISHGVEVQQGTLFMMTRGIVTTDFNVLAGATLKTSDESANSTTAAGAVQYNGKVTLHGDSADDAGVLFYNDGSTNTTNGLYVDGFGKVVNQYDKMQFINGLYNAEDTTSNDITFFRPQSAWSAVDDREALTVLTGSGDFAGTVHLSSTAYTTLNEKYGLQVLGTSAQNALANAVVDFTGDNVSVLSFRNSIEASFDWTNSKMDGAVAGLTGTNGAVYAETLTIGSTENYDFGGALNITNLVKNGTGTQTLSGAVTYTGTTTINAGELVYAGGSATLGAVVMRGSASGETTASQIRFSAKDGAETNTYNFTTLEMSSNGNQGKKWLVVDSGVTVNATGTTALPDGTLSSINNAWGVAGGGLEINGILDTTGVISMDDGGRTSTLTGTGVIKTAGLNISNWNTTTITGGLTVNITSETGIYKRTGSSTLNLGYATLKAESVDWHLKDSLGEVNLTDTEHGTTFNAANGRTITVDKALSGVGSFNKAGAGTVILKGNDTFTGNITIEAGTLEMRNAGGVTLNHVVQSEGNLVLAGNVNLNMDVDTQNATFSRGERHTYGYLTSANVQIATGGTVNIADVTSWSIGGLSAAENLGLTSATLTGTTVRLSGDGGKGLWFMNTGEGGNYTYDGTDANMLAIVINAKHDSEDNTATLHLNADPTALQKITVNDTTANIDIASGFMLSSSKLATSKGGSAVLTGSGTYDLGTLNLTWSANEPSLGTGVSLDASDWHGAVRLSGTATWISRANLDRLTASDSWVEMAGLSGFFDASNDTIDANIIFTNATVGSETYAFKQTNGFSGKDNKFSGKLKGEGTFVTGYTGANHSYSFSGDASEWTGMFLRDSNANTTTVNISNKFGAAIKNTTGTMELNLSDDALVTDAFTGDLTVTGGTVNVNGALNSKQVDADVSGGTLTLKNGGTMGNIATSSTGKMVIGDIESANELSASAYKLTMADSSVLEVKAGTTLTVKPQSGNIHTSTFTGGSVIADGVVDFSGAHATQAQLNYLVKHTTGDGTLKLKSYGTGHHATVQLSLGSQDLTLGVKNLEVVSTTMDINNNNESGDVRTLTVGEGHSMTIGRDMRLENCAGLVVEGDVTVNNTLTLGHPDATGVNGNATLTVNGGHLKVGSFTIANTYEKAVNLESGTFEVANTAALTVSGAAAYNLNGGTLKASGANVTIDHAVNVGGEVTLEAANNNTLAIHGAVNVADDKLADAKINVRGNGTVHLDTETVEVKHIDVAADALLKLKAGASVSVNELVLGNVTAPAAEVGPTTRDIPAPVVVSDGDVKVDIEVTGTQEDHGQLAVGLGGTDVRGVNLTVSGTVDYSAVPGNILNLNGGSLTLSTLSQPSINLSDSLLTPLESHKMVEVMSGIGALTVNDFSLSADAISGMNAGDMVVVGSASSVFGNNFYNQDAQVLFRADGGTGTLLVTPEPATTALSLLALAGLAARRRRH